MTSAIDATVPIAGSPTTASVRSNFATAKNEITNLQNATAYPAPSTVAAAGTNQSGAAALQDSKAVNWFEITPVAAAAGVRWDIQAAGSALYVRNSGANPLYLYPPGAGTINTQGASAPITIPANTTAHLLALSTTRIMTVP